MTGVRDFIRFMIWKEYRYIHIHSELEESKWSGIKRAANIITIFFAFYYEAPLNFKNIEINRVCTWNT